MKKITKIFASVFALLLVCTGVLCLGGCTRKNEYNEKALTLSELTSEVNRVRASITRFQETNLKAMDTLIDGDTNPEHLATGEGHEHDLYGIYEGLGSIVDYYFCIASDVLNRTLGYENSFVLDNKDGSYSLVGFDEDDLSDYIKISAVGNEFTLIYYDLTDNVEEYVVQSKITIGQNKLKIDYTGLVGEEAGHSVVMEYVDKEYGFYLIEYSAHKNKLIQIEFDYAQTANAIIGTSVKWQITTTNTYTSIFDSGVSSNFLTGDNVKIYLAE